MLTLEHNFGIDDIPKRFSSLCPPSRYYARLRCFANQGLFAELVFYMIYLYCMYVFLN